MSVVAQRTMAEPFANRVADAPVGWRPAACCSTRAGPFSGRARRNRAGAARPGRRDERSVQPVGVWPGERMAHGAPGQGPVNRAQAGHKIDHDARIHLGTVLPRQAGRGVCRITWERLDQPDGGRHQAGRAAVRPFGRCPGQQAGGVAGRLVPSMPALRRPPREHVPGKVVRLAPKRRLLCPAAFGPALPTLCEEPWAGCRATAGHVGLIQFDGSRT